MQQIVLLIKKVIITSVVCVALGVGAWGMHKGWFDGLLGRSAAPAPAAIAPTEQAPLAQAAASEVSAPATDATAPAAPEEAPVTPAPAPEPIKPVCEELSHMLQTCQPYSCNNNGDENNFIERKVEGWVGDVCRFNTYDKAGNALMLCEFKADQLKTYANYYQQRFEAEAAFAAASARGEEKPLVCPDDPFNDAIAKGLCKEFPRVTPPAAETPAAPAPQAPAAPAPQAQPVSEVAVPAAQ